RETGTGDGCAGSITGVRGGIATGVARGGGSRDAARMLPVGAAAAAVPGNAGRIDGDARGAGAAAFGRVFLVPVSARVTGSVSVKVINSGSRRPPLSGLTNVSMKAPVTPS